MATNAITAAQGNSLTDLYKTSSLQSKTDAEQQARLAATQSEALKADRSAEEKRRVDAQAEVQQQPTTNLQGQQIGARLNQVA